MNTRIQELAEQAGEYVNDVYTPPVRSKTLGKIWEEGHIGWNEQFNEKFAQLIVQKCIEIFNDDSDNLVFQIHNKISRDKIKQHFGVEECTNELKNF